MCTSGARVDDEERKEGEKTKTDEKTVMKVTRSFALLVCPTKKTV